MVPASTASSSRPASTPSRSRSAASVRREGVELTGSVHGDRQRRAEDRHGPGNDHGYRRDADRRRAERYEAARDQSGNHRGDSDRAQSIQSWRSYSRCDHERVESAGRRRQRRPRCRLFSGRPWQPVRFTAHHAERHHPWDDSRRRLRRRRRAKCFRCAGVDVRLLGLWAELATGGVRINFIPKEGGNAFRGVAFGSFTNSSLQGSNFSQDLCAIRVCCIPT